MRQLRGAAMWQRCLGCGPPPAALRMQTSLCQAASSAADTRCFVSRPSPNSRQQEVNRPQQPRQRRQGGVVRAAAQQPSEMRRDRGDEQQLIRYYATCHPGLEEVVAQELLSPRIGATGAAPGKAGVAFW